jgi:hypothetical protein
MRKPRRFITFANVASLMALVFSMTGGAIAARHYLINSTSQINPKVLRKLHGAIGEIGPIGPQGATGATGPKGTTGPRGEPYPQILVSGASESGDFGIQGAAGELAQTINFRIPLSSAIPKTQIEFIKPGEAGTTNCKGPGLAGKGYLCFYAATQTGTTEPKVLDPETSPRPDGTGLIGFTLEVLGSGPGSAYEGIYTVTEP